MAAHAVGNGPKPVVALFQAGVLVDLAHPAGMRAGCRGPHERARNCIRFHVHGEGLLGRRHEGVPVEAPWMIFSAFCTVLMLTPPPELCTSMLVFVRFSWSAK